jgi:pyoverdine/dityrosine biosynthesis protein Dit1
MNQVQSELMEKQATTDKLRMQVAQIEPLVTLFRAVDDRQLWSDLTRKGGPDPEAIKKLSEIHIKSQEQSKEYIDLKVILTKAEQELSAAQSKRDFYKLAERILENKITKTTFDRKHDEIAVDNKLLLEAQFYVDIMIKNVQVIKFGEPALIYSSQGILVKTSLFFLSSFLLCCFCAFIYEWWVEPLKKE